LPLTDTSIQAAKRREKPYKLFDERGLYLLVTPRGGLWWRFRYQFEGREKLLSLGTYPDVPLKRARAKREEARTLVADGTDPSESRKAAKAAHSTDFRSVAEGWLKLQEKVLQRDSLSRIRDRLQIWIFPHVGRRPIGAIEAPDLLACFRLIEARNRHETAHRARADCGRVFRFAIAAGLAKRDPTADLKGALAPVKITHFAAITNPADVGQLLRAIDGYSGQSSVEIALKLAPYLFVRSGELRNAEWSEIHLETAEWRIPATKMKMRRPHIVPLSRQALALLLQLQPHTTGGRYLFPTLQDPQRPMSENTLNAALRRMGYTTKQMTAHGFRSMASTLLNEKGVHPDLIELQLAHKERNETRGAYNRAERLQERRKMMQQYANYLDQLRSAAGRK
jgi:integrase